MSSLAEAAGAEGLATYRTVIDLKVNGRATRLSVANNDTLLDVLRDSMRLTGVKCGCGNGECGACTVVKDGQAVCSCLTLAVECDGSEILTIEGLANQDGELHPLQRAFVEHFAIQCGYCTPGMIMSAYALLAKNQSPTNDEIREAIKGTLCRCTGYVNIVKAVSAAAAMMKEA
jgi:aerobic carbon-monoxide dehydrogenase small subunit